MKTRRSVDPRDHSEFPSAEADRDRSMVRIRLRVNGDARSGLLVGVGSGTDYPNIHKLREAIGVTLFPDPSFVRPE